MRIITCAPRYWQCYLAYQRWQLRPYQGTKPGAQDGDSIITADGRHIRLICIDAPEIRQPHGKRAKRFLAKLIKNGITIKKRGSDQYGRTLAIVKITINGKRQTANEAMIRALWSCMGIQKIQQQLRHSQRKTNSIRNPSPRGKARIMESPKPNPPMAMALQKPPPKIGGELTFIPLKPFFCQNAPSQRKQVFLPFFYLLQLKSIRIHHSQCFRHRQATKHCR